MDSAEAWYFSSTGQEYPFLLVSEIFLSCCLSLGSEGCLNLPIILYYNPIMLNSTNTLATSPVNCMQDVKLTPSDVQEMSL